jgi:hypothetical protein
MSRLYLALQGEDYMIRSAKLHGLIVTARGWPASTAERIGAPTTVRQRWG